MRVPPLLHATGANWPEGLVVVVIFVIITTAITLVAIVQAVPVTVIAVLVRPILVAMVAVAAAIARKAIDRALELSDPQVQVAGFPLINAPVRGLPQAILKRIDLLVQAEIFATREPTLETMDALVQLGDPRLIVTGLTVILLIAVAIAVLTTILVAVLAAILVTI